LPLIITNLFGEQLNLGYETITKVVKFIRNLYFKHINKVIQIGAILA